VDGVFAFLLAVLYRGSVVEKAYLDTLREMHKKLKAGGGESLGKVKA
jgi:hypothetical protein